MSRFDASETVSTRATRCVATHIDAARIGVAPAGRQVLRKPQVDAVVDRDHRPARRQRRQHVVRRVKQVDAARGADRAGPSTARESSSRATRPEPRGSSRPVRATNLDGRPAAEHDVLGRLIDAAPGAAAGCGRTCRCRSRAASGRRWLCAPTCEILSGGRAPGGSVVGGSCTPFSRRYHAAAAHSADGASRRTPAGCGDRRRSIAAGARRARPAAQVDDLGGGREEHLPAARADRRAEIDVLGVEEEPLVEQADRLGVGARDEQARAADPVDELLACASPLDPAR